MQWQAAERVFFWLACQVSDFEVELHLALRSTDAKGDAVDLGECLLNLGNVFLEGDVLDHQQFSLLPNKRMPVVVPVEGWLEISLWFEPFVVREQPHRNPSSHRLLHVGHSIVE